VKWSGLIGGVVRGEIGRVIAAPALARGGGVGGGEEEGSRRRSATAAAAELVGARRGVMGRGGHAQCWGSSRAAPFVRYGRHAIT
jgi:hypothetical protein